MVTPSWILKAPRVVLIFTFPVITFILYCTVPYLSLPSIVLLLTRPVILSLGCITDSLSGISPVIAQSNGNVTIGGQSVQVDLRIGFLGVCFGPAPFNCTGSISAFQNKRQSQLAAEIPLSKGGGNFGLAGLALGLQSSFVVLSGFPLLLLLIAATIANIIQLYFNSAGAGSSNTSNNPNANNNNNPSLLTRRERHAQAALWARSLDWAAAAGAVTSFAAYQSIVAAATRLLAVTVDTGGVPLVVSVGTTASNLFAAVVVLTLVGALVNTLLAAKDVGFDAYLAGKGVDGGGGKTGGGRGGGGSSGGGMMGVGGVYTQRPAYERFV
ncbi:hypothetical protein B0J18DRAFT_409915 [Chaetomium sp. MPI-SDFR-AT-0129]|nr:hypothetical protein B0J18DRAFT_409915 [Chaetomium sp. MPI-SDFR-AT-0129]